jgi:acetoin utilization deacetylase AcuC-like enzyme
MKATITYPALRTIPVFYSDNMVADSECYSPSAEKPKAVVTAWQAMHVNLTIVPPVPVTSSQLDLAHDSMYVSEVLMGKARNGFGNCSTAIARSLPWTSGTMLSAARAALANGRVAVAPCSGFHHAGYDYGGGYCTFNGLMVTAAVLLKESAVQRVGIIDFDQHWGDGTQDIIDRRSLSKKVRHYHPTMQRFPNRNAMHFLDAIPEIVGQFADCDLVLYQAGADPHINDPLGGWLTTEELRLRDQTVFSELARMQVPVAWNLAGGYQRDAQGSIRPVLAIHENTMTECANVHLATHQHRKATPSRL